MKAQPSVLCPNVLFCLGKIAGTSSLGKKWLSGMILVLKRLNLALLGTIMGFADLSILDIAEDYNLSVEAVLSLCDRLGISYRNAQTRLALEDAKAIIAEVTVLQGPSTPPAES